MYNHKHKTCSGKESDINMIVHALWSANLIQLDVIWAYKSSYINHMSQYNNSNH